MIGGGEDGIGQRPLSLELEWALGWALEVDKGSDLDVNVLKESGKGVEVDRRVLVDVPASASNVDDAGEVRGGKDDDDTHEDAIDAHDGFKPPMDSSRVASKASLAFFRASKMIFVKPLGRPRFFVALWTT